MRRAIKYLFQPSRHARLAWGTEVQRWTLLLVMAGLPLFAVAGTLTTWSGAENAKMVCALCALGGLLTLLPMVMQAKDVEY